MDTVTLIGHWCILFCVTLWKGCIADSAEEMCTVDPSEFISSDGTFEVYQFEAEEGILLEPRRLLGTVILSGNSSASYSFDEPYFKRPGNLKASPQPKHFEIVFEDINSNNDSTTMVPTSGEAATSAPPTTGTTSNNTRPKRSLDVLTGSADGQISGFSTDRPDSTFTQTTTYTSLVTTTSYRNHTDYTTEEASTDKPLVNCVKAYIYQVYDLDREERDTYHLTISNLEGDLLSIPILIVINVSDINDNTPIFDEDSLLSTISNDTAMGLIVGQIKANDDDIGANADLRYEMLFHTERRGNETESSYFPSVLLQQSTGIVVLIRSVEDLSPPSKITFSVVVKDNGDRRVCNRATATATISIVDINSFTSLHPSSAVSTGTVGIIVGCSVGVAVIGLILYAVYRIRRSRVNIRNDGALEFMLDDETLVSA